MLRLTNLRKSFGHTLAVDGLSLDIQRGEVFGLLGPNGAGKSTTIGIAVGLIKPDSGTVDLDGKGSCEQPEVRRMLGVAPQSLALYDELSAFENLVFFGRVYGLSGAAAAKCADEKLDLVGLLPRKKDRVKGFSGGMKRRLNLAASLVHDPPLLLLDEPTAGVDPQSRNSILDLVRTLAAQGRTIVYTTHYMEEAARLCSRVGIIDKGKLLALGSVNDLIRDHGGKSHIIVTRDGADHRSETDNPLAELQRVLAGPQPDAVRIERADLESVFLNLTGRSLRD